MHVNTHTDVWTITAQGRLSADYCVSTLTLRQVVWYVGLLPNDFSGVAEGERSSQHVEQHNSNLPHSARLGLVGPVQVPLRRSVFCSSLKSQQ